MNGQAAVEWLAMNSLFAFALASMITGIGMFFVGLYPDAGIFFGVAWKSQIAVGAGMAVFAVGAVAVAFRTRIVAEVCRKGWCSASFGAVFLGIPLLTSGLVREQQAYVGDIQAEHAKMSSDLSHYVAVRKVGGVEVSRRKATLDDVRHHEAQSTSPAATVAIALKWLPILLGGFFLARGALILGPKAS